jgi:hypothetical protein
VSRDVCGSSTSEMVAHIGSISESERFASEGLEKAQVMEIACVFTPFAKPPKEIFPNADMLIATNF